jgi:hypothetical protein
MVKKSEKKEAAAEIDLMDRDHGMSKAYPGPWKIGKGGRHLYFWPDTETGCDAAEARGLLVDVVLMRAGEDLDLDAAEATIRRASASPDMEAVLLDMLRIWERGPTVDSPEAAGRAMFAEGILDAARAALKKSGAL